MQMAGGLCTSKASESHYIRRAESLVQRMSNTKDIKAHNVKCVSARGREVNNTNINKDHIYILTLL